MAQQWQLRRGTTAQHNSFTGAAGEVTVDTTTHALKVHDGVKQGGYTVDTVVAFQVPTSANNYTWYRKYASGWVEQGGVVTNSGDSTFSTVTLPVKMNSTNYTVTATQKSNITSMPNTCFAGYYIQSDQVVLIGNRGINGEYARTQSWEVKGMAA